MNLSYKKLIASALLVTTVLVTTLSPTAMLADETVIKLSRDQVGQMAVESGSAVRDLELSQKDLVIQYGEVKTAMDGLQAAFDLLPTYRGMYNSYNALDSNHKMYLSLITSSDPLDQAEAIEMIDGVVDLPETTDDEKALKELAEAAELALSAAVTEPAVWGPSAYGQFLAMQKSFAIAGVSNPNLSNREEYEIFASPINDTLASMQSGIVGLTIGIDSARAGVSSGAETLYDSLLGLEEILALQESNYQIALNDFTNAKERYLKGQLSEVDYLISANKEEIARRNRNSMQRNVDNLMMSFNLMLGQDMMAQLELATEVKSSVELETLDAYIERGLKERSEILTAENTLNQSQSSFSLIDDYFNTSSDKYRAAEKELEVAKRDLESAKVDVEYNIRKAYLNVTEKKENLSISQLALEDAKRQYNELELNVSLGFVTESMLNQVGLLVTVATNDYYSSYRDYEAAIQSLESSSSIGPAYSASNAMAGM